MVNSARFVLMSIEDFAKLKGKADCRRVYGPGETPEKLSRMFLKEIGRLLEDGNK
jgi:hypothetical protein